MAMVDVLVMTFGMSIVVSVVLVRMRMRGGLTRPAMRFAVRSRLTYIWGLGGAVLFGALFAAEGGPVVIAMPILGFITSACCSLAHANATSQAAALAAFANLRGLSVWQRSRRRFRLAMVFVARLDDPIKRWLVPQEDLTDLRRCVASFRRLTHARDLRSDKTKAERRTLAVTAIASGVVDGRRALVGSMFDIPSGGIHQRDRPYSVVWIDAHLAQGELFVVPRLARMQLLPGIRAVPTESAVVAQSSVVLATRELSALDAMMVLEPTALVALGDSERPVEVHVSEDGLLVARRHVATSEEDLDELLRVAGALARTVSRRAAA
jgi:hypothetical protein